MPQSYVPVSPLGERRAMSQEKYFGNDNGRATLTLDRPLRMLSAWQVQQIDEALGNLGPFGEVRLVKNRGRLRFIQRVESASALEPPGPIEVGLKPIPQP